MFPTILAKIDFQQIVGLLILVISVLSWFVNLVNGKTPDGNPRPQKTPKAKSDPSEIERLLEELTADKKPRRPEPKRTQQPPRPPKPPVDRYSQRPSLVRPKIQPEPVVKHPSARISQSSLPTPDLGASVRTHHLANHVEESVEKDINRAVQVDLGNRFASSEQNAKEPQVHPLFKMLRDPIGVRQAILLNEVLKRPKYPRH